MPDTHRTTRYSDVCGGTDEFKRILTEEPLVAESQAGRETLESLLEDGMYMLHRMSGRLGEYEAFREEVRHLLATLDAVVPPDMPEAEREASHIRQAVARSDTGLDARTLIHQAEEVRQVANDMEGALRRHQEGAIVLARAYATLRGQRGWPDGLSTEKIDPTLGTDIPAWIPQAWLPPDPHAERIVNQLTSGRASLLSEIELDSYPVGPQGREPIVQFEDGGVMPLRVVRWDEAVQNFHPLGQQPHPRGLKYRPRDAGPDAQPA